MTDKLRECPFCGGKARKQAKEIEGIRVLYVLCERCGASGGVFRTRKPRVKDEENPAIKAWNNRKPMDRIVEQLEYQAEINRLNGMEKRAGKKQTTGYCLGINKAIDIVKGVQNE